MDEDKTKNRGLQVAGEHGAETTANRYGKDFLLAKIREKQGYSQTVRDALGLYAPGEPEAVEVPHPAQSAMSSMARILGPGGIVAQRLEGYESRLEQVRMAQVVADAIVAGEHAIVEAGTGVGKSLAYLIPAIYSGKKTVVSTGDKNLQDQLWRKDIPFLKSVSPVTFWAAILKGKGNYLCLERYNEEIGTQELMGKSHEFAAVQRWLEETTSGDLEELPISLSTDLHGRLTSTADACTGKHCPSFDSCYAEKAKTLADRADIVIVNHSLLSLDAAIRRDSEGYAHVVSDRDLVIIDEAHRLEDAATLAFTTELSPLSILRLLHDKHMHAATVDPERIAALEERTQAFFGALARLSDRQTYVIAEAPESVQQQAEALARGLRDLARELRRCEPYQETAKLEAFNKFAERVATCSDTVVGILQPSTSHVIYVEKKHSTGKRPLTYLKRCPISVAEDLRESLFDAWPVVCTSATLATGKDFAYFKSRVGCDAAQELLVGSPFDYKRNALIYLPADGHAFDPSKYYQDGSPEYFDRLARQIEQLLLASDGRAFCLFTSNKALNEVYDRIAHRLQWLVLKQGEMPRPEVVRQFKSDGRAVLFGTRSFFEGVDVQGEALSLVIIDKIPFGQPDDPIYDARCQEIVQRTGNKWAWFNQLALPNAIITYKQGFGRLIRTKADRGVVALLDGRLTVKSYGTTVVRSLPPATITRSLEAVQAFFAAHARG